MRTNYRDGLIDIRLSKPETITLEKAAAKTAELAVMQPIARAITEAATDANAALTRLLKHVGCDVPKTMPLFDQPEDKAADPAQVEPPPETISKRKK